MIKRPISQEALMQKVAELPPDGLAAVVRFIDSWQLKVRSPTGTSTPGTGEHPAFGLWADRTNIQDSVVFTQQLRRRIEERRDA